MDNQHKKTKIARCFYLIGPASHRRAIKTHCPKVYRKTTGSALSEFGPAIFILFVFAVFPAIDLIFMGLAYCACVSLNTMELRAAAKVSASEAQPAALAMQEKWSASGLGNLLGLVNYPSINVSYQQGSATVYGADQYVSVTTSFYVRPLLTIPFFSGVPGLGAPITFSVSQRQLLEDPTNAGG
jgi:hypothetical protein